MNIKKTLLQINVECVCGFFGLGNVCGADIPNRSCQDFIWLLAQILKRLYRYLGDYVTLSVYTYLGSAMDGERLIVKIV